MKHFRLLIGSLSITAMLLSCKGEQGDPGPIGPVGEQGPPGERGQNGNDAELTKAGSFEGTVTGTRRDGTPIQETFKFEYKGSYNKETFEQNAGEDIIYLSRSGNAAGGGWMEMDLKRVNNTLTNRDENMEGLYLEKELASNKLFKLVAAPYFMDSPGFVEEINDVDNELYQFFHGYNPNNRDGIYYEETKVGGEPVYSLASDYSNTPNGVALTVLYRISDGSLMMLRDGVNDITFGPLFDIFNNIKMQIDPVLGIPVFFAAGDVTTGESLATIIPDTPADEITITNYAMNATTGIITFDYVLKINAFRGKQNGQNTTGHDLTISGKFNSGERVYDSVVGRIGS